MKKDVRELLSTAKEEEQHREEWRLRLALMKESTGYRDFGTIAAPRRCRRINTFRISMQGMVAPGA